MFEMMPFRRPGSHLRRRADYFDHLFDNFFADFMPVAVDAKLKPFKVDVKENENEYVVEADLPGIKKEAIEIEYENNYLTITAKTEEGKDEEKENYLRRERYWGQFQRRFFIDNINKEGIDASFKDGVLKIVLPKEQPGKENKKIDIK